MWQRHATQNAIEAVRWRARRAIREAGSGPPPFETGGEGIFCKQPSEKIEHAWLITEKLLAEMSREVRADGAEFVLAVLPTGWQLYNDIWARIENAGGRDAVDMWNPDVKLCEIGQRIGIHVVLMTERFWRAAPHRSRDIEEELLHYAGVGHFNDRGNDLAAKILAEDLDHGRAQLASTDQDEE